MDGSFRNAPARRWRDRLWDIAPGVCWALALVMAIVTVRLT